MKRIHGTLLAGAVILTAAIMVIPRQAGTPAVAESSFVRHAAPPGKDGTSKSPRRPPSVTESILSKLPPPVPSPYPPAAAGGQQWIAGRVAELDRLAWFADTQSLHKILAELRNPLPEIRSAALAATLAFSSRESIPYLEMFARESTDPQEQKALTAAIEHLKLPTMVEELERQQNAPAPTETEAP